MKARVLEKRLRKAESTLRCEPNVLLDQIFALQWFAVAYYLGNPSRNEKPFAAYARALGYASESELNKALDNKDRDLLKRFVTAEETLFAKFDYTSSTDGWDKHSEAILRMQAGLPKSYMDQIERVVMQAKISLVWLRNKSGDIAAYIRFFA
jgi:hypothetical protein